MSKPDLTRLTEKQRKFVQAYLKNGNNAADAYRQAYETKSNAQGVAVLASKLLAHAKIAPIVAAARAKAAESVAAVVDRYALDKAGIAKALTQLSAYNVLDYYTVETVPPAKEGDPPTRRLVMRPLDEISREAAFAIVGIEQEKDGSLRYKLADKRAALMDLAKLRGDITEKRDVRVIRKIEDLSQEELAALAAEGERDE